MNNRRITRQSVDRSGNRYCGPLVIAALLGCSTAEAAAKVREATNVVNVTGHYVLIAGRKFVDTGTRGEWVSIAKAPHRRTRVENVWQVSR